MFHKHMCFFQIVNFNFLHNFLTMRDKDFMFCIYTQLVKSLNMTSRFLCRLRSLATHRDHFVRRLSVRLSVCPFVTLTELCYAGDTCIPRNAATIFVIPEDIVTI